MKKIINKKSKKVYYDGNHVWFDYEAGKLKIGDKVSVRKQGIKTIKSCSINGVKGATLK